MKLFWAIFWALLLILALFGGWTLGWWGPQSEKFHTVAAQSQTNTLCTVKLDPPVPGELLCWQTRCWVTDAQGVWKHSITVIAGQWYEFVLDSGGPISIEGIRGPSNASVMLMSGKRARFKFNSTPGASSGPFTLFVASPEPTITPSPSLPPEPTSTPTPGPSATPTVWEPPTPTWPPMPQPPATLDPNERLPWLLLKMIEEHSLEEEETNPPVLLVIQQHRIYWAALTHNGTVALWVQGYNSEGPKNWRIPAGRPETGIFRVQYDGDWVTCLAFSNMIAIEVESSGRIFIMQYGGYILAECYPGTAWEVIE